LALKSPARITLCPTPMRRSKSRSTILPGGLQTEIKIIDSLLILSWNFIVFDVLTYKNGSPTAPLSWPVRPVCYAVWTFKFCGRL
jgi:hypothetical protein